MSYGYGEPNSSQGGEANSYQGGEANSYQGKAIYWYIPKSNNPTNI